MLLVYLSAGDEKHRPINNRGRKQMKNRLLSDAEAEQILGGREEIVMEDVNYAEGAEFTTTGHCVIVMRVVSPCSDLWGVTTPGCERIVA